MGGFCPAAVMRWEGLNSFSSSSEAPTMGFRGSRKGVRLSCRFARARQAWSCWSPAAIATHHLGRRRRLVAIFFSKEKLARMQHHDRSRPRRRLGGPEHQPPRVMVGAAPLGVRQTVAPWTYDRQANFPMHSDAATKCSNLPEEKEFECTSLTDHENDDVDMD